LHTGTLCISIASNAPRMFRSDLTRSTPCLELLRGLPSALVRRVHKLSSNCRDSPLDLCRSRAHKRLNMSSCSCEHIRGSKRCLHRIFAGSNCAATLSLGARRFRGFLSSAHSATTRIDSIGIAPPVPAAFCIEFVFARDPSSAQTREHLLTVFVRVGAGGLDVRCLVFPIMAYGPALRRAKRVAGPGRAKIVAAT